MRYFLTLFAFFLFTYSPAVNAQEADALPELPAPIQTLVNEGAQIRYLGKDHGLDSWLTIKNGVEQYFYVMPDGKAFVMGVLFDDTGKLVTLQQVNRLRSQGDDLLDDLAEFPTTTNANEVENEAFDFKSPSEQLFSDIERSNWVPLGRTDAPAVYAFIDPQCGYCHSFINNLRSEGYLENGKIQLRMIPVGFRDETKAQAAFLMATPNPQERWFKHMAGDETALPAKSEINRQGVERNLAIMQSWKFDVTPMIVYRGKDGTVKLVRGTPNELTSFIADLSTPG